MEKSEWVTLLKFSDTVSVLYNWLENWLLPVEELGSNVKIALISDMERGRKLIPEGELLCPLSGRLMHTILGWRECDACSEVMCRGECHGVDDAADDLLPCPFCGSPAQRNDGLTKGVEGAVECTVCSAASLVSDWNNRQKKSVDLSRFAGIAREDPFFEECRSKKQ